MLSDFTIIKAISNFGGLTEENLAFARTLAEGKLRQMTGDLYNEVAGDESHAAHGAFVVAESALAVVFYLPPKNMNAQSNGVLKTATVAGGDVSTFLTPAELQTLQTSFLEMAEEAVTPFLPPREAATILKAEGSGQ